MDLIYTCILFIENNFNRISMDFKSSTQYRSATNSPKPKFYVNKSTKQQLYHKINTECSLIENRNLGQQNLLKKNRIIKTLKSEGCQFNKETLILNEIISQFRNVAAALDQETTRNKLLSQLIPLLQNQSRQDKNNTKMRSQLDLQISQIHSKINAIKKSSNDINSKILHLKNAILEQRNKRVQFSEKMSVQQKKLKKFQQQFKETACQCQCSRTQLKNLQQYHSRQTSQHPSLSKTLVDRENSMIIDDRMTLNPHNALNFYTGKRDMTLVKSRKNYIPSMKFFRIEDLEKMQNQIKQYKYVIQKLQTISGIETPLLQQTKSYDIQAQNQRLINQVNQIINSIAYFESQNTKLRNKFLQKNSQLQANQQNIMEKLLDFMYQIMNGRKCFINKSSSALQRNIQTFKKFVNRCFQINIQDKPQNRQKTKQVSKVIRSSMMMKHYQEALKQLQLYNVKNKEKSKSSHNIKKRI